ncbi:hypothetical protein [Lacibacter cauensis]|nr:hypothetical protein [Lacibacter cauensis]
METDRKLKKQARELLLPKVQEAIRIVKSNQYKKALHTFYLHVWQQDSSSLLNYLTYIETSLKTGVALPNTNSLYKTFIQAFDKNLKSDTLTSFVTKLSDNNTTLELWKINPFNSFVMDLYNYSLPEITSDTAVKLAKENIIENTYALMEQKLEIEGLLKKYRTMESFRKEFYDSLITVHANITAASSAFQQNITMFQKNWFKQWFWFRGGEIRLNPIDVTTNDSAKISYRNLLDTNTIKKLNNTQLSFVLEERLDTLVAINNRKDSLLQVATRLMNKVTIPASGAFYNYSAYKDIKFESSKKYILSAIETEQHKTIAVHNVSLGEKAGLLEKNNPFDDRSPFQEGLDTVVGTLGQLAKIYASLSPYAGILDLFSGTKKLSNSAINYDPSIKYDKNNIDDETGKAIVYVKRFTIAPFQFEYNNFNEGKPFKNKLKIELYNYSLLNETVFNQLFYSNESIKVAAGKIKEYENLLTRYFNEITSIAIQDLKKDSFLLASVINIYSNSTYPRMEKLETIKDESAVYFSKILETTPVQKPTEKDVTVFTFNSKDTTIIGKFSYKVGLRYRFKLSAGIAYTLSGYNQSKAVQDANGITITNNVRQYRFIAGMHVYLGKGLYNQSTSLLDKDLGRNYLFVGIGIPDPLGNVYIGAGRDLVPGLKLTAGIHIVKNNTYLIQNNMIQEERVKYQYGGPFVALQIDPTSFISFLDNLTKLK